MHLKGEGEGSQGKMLRREEEKESRSSNVRIGIAAAKIEGTADILKIQNVEK